MTEEQCRKLALELLGGWKLEEDGRSRKILGDFFRLTRKTSPAARDKGYVMSMAQDLTEIRFFHRRVPVKRVSPETDAEARRAVRAFGGLCRRLNERYGFRFPVSALAEVASLFEEGSCPGWPFFGFKLGPGPNLRLVLYVIEPRPPIAEFLRRGVSLLRGTTRQIRAAGCRGALDAAGLSLAHDGQIELKLYCKEPPTRKDDAASRHSAHARWCRSLGQRYPIRYWTSAYNFGDKGRLLGTVKREAHFIRGVPPEALSRDEAAGSAEWLSSVEPRVKSVGGRIYTLGISGDRPYVYFG